MSSATGAEDVLPAEWPAIGWEDVNWTSTIPPDQVSRNVRERHTGPYRAAVVPSIAKLHPRLLSAIATLADEATAEISRFDAEIGSELAPFAAVLLRSESASSSRIENLTSSAKAIALAELGSPEKRNASEIVANVEAMKAAISLADRLDADAILSMHAALMHNRPSETPGVWRNQQVWIGGDSYGPHGATFTPPHHRHVLGAIDDLVRFTQRTDVPLLTQAAIAHAQFETIHPFTDGNGRTGRALIHAMLRGHGLTRKVTVPVSAGLLADTPAYFETLTDYRNGDPSSIVEQVATAAFAAMTNGRQLVAELNDIRTAWEDKIVARRDSAAWRLAEVLLRQPVIDAAVVADELGLTMANALRPIAPLVEAGVLTEFTGFKRNRMWQSREVLTALDAFASRAGRRG
ncbi:MAG: Fic family protein [Actinomycetota bacterium]|nr:Fic family protein [Actinomycetota bacterium]